MAYVWHLFPDIPSTSVAIPRFILGISRFLVPYISHLVKRGPSNLPYINRVARPAGSFPCFFGEVESISCRKVKTQADLASSSDEKTNHVRFRRSWADLEEPDKRHLVFRTGIGQSCPILVKPDGIRAPDDCIRLQAGRLILSDCAEEWERDWEKPDKPQPSGIYPIPRTSCDSRH